MSSQYGNNESGENICVDKLMELSKDWTESQVIANMGKSVSGILKSWAESHSDEYDQPYYSIIMTPAINACLLESRMLEKVREKRYNDDRFKKAQLANWKKEKERCLTILDNELFGLDGAKRMYKKVSKMYDNLVEMRNNANTSYQAIRNSNALNRFDETLRYINRVHSKHIHLEVREKKADLEKERIEFLKHRMDMEFLKYTVDI
jgi:hypothetical protein